jgi:O-antigen biosynthesis protein
MELETEAQALFEGFYGGFNRGFNPVVFGLDRPHGRDRLFPYAPGRFGTGANMAFRRATLNALGGFDEALGTGTRARGGEDLAIFISLLLTGSELAVEPAAYVFHTHRRTYPELVSQVRNYGIGLTAMYTSLVMKDRRHLTAILVRLPRALVDLNRSKNGTLTPVDGGSDMPRGLRAVQAAGMALGPLAYLASRVTAASRGSRGAAKARTSKTTDRGAPSRRHGGPMDSRRPAAVMTGS